MKRRGYFKSVIVIGVSLSLGALFWIMIREDSETDAVCGGSRGIGVRAILGGTDDLLERAAFEGLVKSSPSCANIKQIHAFNGPKNIYYYDNERYCDGNDLDEDNGIDVAPVLFFAGHGDPDKWLTDSDEIKPGCMRIGNAKAGGKLRYYFQCSCQVFAHGPAITKDTYLDYPEPWNFTGPLNTESATRRNIFLRWGPVLGDGVRMACGSSTAITCRRDQVERMWMNKRAYVDVSTSFIEGLYAGPDSIPLCLARSIGKSGEHAPEVSPLFDSVFLEEPRATDGSAEFFLIEYPRAFASKPPKPGSLPATFPVYNLVTSKPGGIHLINGSSKYFEWFGRFRLKRADILVYKDETAILSPLRARCPEDPACKRDDWYARRARRFIERMRWVEPEIGSPEGFRLLIDSIPIMGGESVRFQKGVVVRFRRQIRTNLLTVTERDLDGNIVVFMNNQGQVVNAWKLWLPTDDHIARQVEVYPQDISQLQEAAMQELGKDNAGYKLTGFEIIYKRSGEELAPFAAFRAVPREPGTLINFPPRRVDIPIEVVRR